MTSRRPFTLLGILLAVLVIAAFVLVAINASAGQLTTMQSVVVASKDLSPRVPIDSGSLELKSIATSGYPAGTFFTKQDEVVGMIPLVTITQGQPITSNVVAKPGTTLGSESEFLPIPEGYVALTLPTSEQQGVGGYIAPGDYIAVIATVSVNAKVATMTVFKHVHVIRVGPPQAGTQPASTAPATSLTIVVTECDAEFITWFQTYAALKYVLESYHDYGPSTTSPDTNCPSVDSAKGVNLKDVQAKFPALFS